MKSMLLIVGAITLALCVYVAMVPAAALAIASAPKPPASAFVLTDVLIVAATVFVRRRSAAAVKASRQELELEF